MLGVGITAVLLFMALVVFLSAPGISRRAKWPAGFFRHDFAHRGLHGGSVPENSLSAFRRAAGKGYGIELDVQLTRDGEPVVHHDPSLLRTCGADVLIRDILLSQLKQYRLGDSGETVPTFQETLNCVAGRAPLIVELKPMGRRNGELAQKALDCLSAYSGSWVVESFDPRLMRWFRLHAPQAIRGQLAYDPRLGGLPNHGIISWLGARLLMNFLSRPDFLAYQHESEKNLSFRLVRALFKPVTVAWTVKTEETCQRLRGSYDLQIFEGFEP